MLKEGDLQDAPLHNKDKQDLLQVFDPVPKASDKQLSATMIKLMHEGDKASSQSGEVYVDKGLLPPVPLKLARKVRAGDYIKMEEFLPEVGTLEDDILEPKHRCSRQASDIFMWLQCFGVYISICGVQFLEIIPELMAYVTNIIRFNREYSGSEWRNYYSALQACCLKVEGYPLVKFVDAKV